MIETFLYPIKELKPTVGLAAVLLHKFRECRVWFALADFVCHRLVEGGLQNVSCFSANASASKYRDISTEQFTHEFVANCKLMVVLAKNAITAAAISVHRCSKRHNVQIEGLRAFAQSLSNAGLGPIWY